MQRLREIWDAYSATMLPNTAGPIQSAETERAFYSGAIATIKLITATPGDQDYGSAMAKVLAEIESWQKIAVPEGKPRG